jgi:hypothetical protein
MIRVLLDQGLAPRAAALLRAAGWDAIHVTEIGLQRADDKDILKAAREDSRVVSHSITTFIVILPWRSLRDPLPSSFVLRALAPKGKPR